VAPQTTSILFGGRTKSQKPTKLGKNKRKARKTLAQPKNTISRLFGEGGV
jgi:hypothetical protein